jgi:hypothetical protein
LIQDIEKVKERIWDLLEFDWDGTHARGAAQIRRQLERMIVYDGDKLLIGAGNGSYDFMTSADFRRVEKKISAEIMRGKLRFFYVTKAIKMDDTRFMLEGTIDPGLMECLVDIVVDTLAIDRHGGLWRRLRNRTWKIQEIGQTYAVTKDFASSSDILRALLDYAFTDNGNFKANGDGKKLNNMVAAPGIAFNGLKHDGYMVEKLEDTDIPFAIFDKVKIDVKKAQKFFDLITPEEDSQHNIKLSCIYPFFRLFAEKFFVLRARGGNGKSAFLQYWETLFPDKYQPIELGDMSTSGFEKKSAIAAISGKLVLHSPETDLRDPKFMSTLKQIATGDPLIGRTIGGNQFSFRNEAVLYVDTNDPVALGNEPAMNRRKVGIRFTHHELSYEEVKPYMKWIQSPDGACSIYALCYDYYCNECNHEIEFKKVDLNAKFKGEVPPPEFQSYFRERLLTEEVYKITISPKKLREYSRSESELIIKNYDLKEARKNGVAVWRINHVHACVQQLVREGILSLEDINVMKKLNNYQHRDCYSEYSTFAKGGG